MTDPAADRFARSVIPITWHRLPSPGSTSQDSAKESWRQAPTGGNRRSGRPWLTTGDGPPAAGPNALAATHRRAGNGSRPGPALSESRGATSYHLRQLARFGFVVDAPSGNDRRTTRWRAAAARSILRLDLLRHEPAADEAAVALMTSQVTPVVDAVARTLRSSRSEWRGSVITFDHEMRLTPGQLANLRTELRGVIERYFEGSIAGAERRNGHPVPRRRADRPGLRGPTDRRRGQPTRCCSPCGPL